MYTNVSAETVLVLDNKRFMQQQKACISVQ